MQGRSARPRRRRWPLATLGVGVTLAHLGLVGRFMPSRLGEGAADTRPRRIDISFVRELQPAAPEPVSVAAAPPRRKRLASALPGPATAASAVPDEPLPSTLMPLLPDPDAPLASGEIPLLSDEPLPAVLTLAPGAPPFDWPPSTRLRYALTGHYRGPVQGQAQVEWLREGNRYQVRVDVSIGPSFAPLMSRQAVSEGLLTPEGLRPSRYDEQTRIALLEPRRLSIHLDADAVRLPDGTLRTRPDGVQDSASQFVQLTWLFTLQPERLRAGQSVELPLALPRSVMPWIYDVIGPETLDTPFGPLETVHVKPRREAAPGQDLTAEVWIAPTLQYLPVRILIRQDAQTHMDLMVDSLPLQAQAPENAARQSSPTPQTRLPANPGEPR